MWPLLKAEFRYHQKIFLGFLVLLPIILSYAIYPFHEDMTPGLWMFVMIFLMLQNWNTFRNKEKRDRQHATLPLSLNIIAGGRILLVIFPALGYIVLYALLVWVLDPVEPLSHRKLLTAFGFILLGFSVYFIFRDFLLSFFRKIGFNKSRMIVAGLLIILGFNLLALAAFMHSNSGGRLPFDIKPIITFFKTTPLFNSDDGVAKFLGFNFLIACLTVFSFSRRKAYLE